MSHLRPALFLLVAVALLSSGCLTLSTPLSADALRAGEVEAGGSLSGVHSPGSFQDASDPLLPTGEVSLRYGVADGHELGAKLFTVGAAVLSRHTLLRPADGGDGLRLSVEPQLSAYDQVSFSGTYGGGLKLVPQVSLYAGQRWGAHEVLLTARAVDFLHLSRPAGTLHQPYLGGGLTYSLRVHGPLRVGAYVAYLHPLVRIAGYQDAAILQGGPILTGTWSTR